MVKVTKRNLTLSVPVLLYALSVLEEWDKLQLLWNNL